MSSPKFFKSHKSTNKRILRSNSKSQNKKAKTNESETNSSSPSEHHSSDSFSDSGLSDFSSTSLLSENFGENLYNDDLEPLFRCSTPNRNSYNREPFSSTRKFNISNSKKKEKNDSNNEKVDLWEKAINENPSLRNWIDTFNDEMKMVEQSSLNIKSVSDSKT